MPAPYHIVYVLHSLGRGGTENGVVNLLNGLDPERFRFTLALIQQEREMLARVERDGVEVVTVGRRKGNDPLLPLRLAKVFRRAKPDLVHTRAFSCIDGIPAARLAGVRSVLHSEHGRDVDEATQMKRRRAVLRSLLYPMANAVATVSEELSDWLASNVHVRREKLVCVPNGVELARFAAAPSRLEAVRSFGVPEDAIVVGSVGRHDPVKDYGCLLRSFARLYSEESNVHLLLVGGGPQHEALVEQATELGISSRVHFAGWCDDLPRAFAAIDVFVLPSVTEGMSNALLEAMAAGLPCIATAVGGNAEVIEHGSTGLMVPPRDPTVMGETIARLASDAELRARFGAAGRRRVETHFTLPKMIARYEELYLSLIERGTGARSAGRREETEKEQRRASHARPPRRAATPVPQDVAARAERDR